MPLSLAKLQNILQMGLDRKEVWSPVLRAPRAKAAHTSDSATDSLENFNKLVEKLQTLKAKGEDDNLIFKIRYLMPDENTLLVAREGKPSAEVPGHKDMSNRCIAAGNLYLSPDFNTVIGINHDSGDFKPTMGSLVFPLRQLMEKNLLDSTHDLTLSYRLTPHASVLAEPFSYASLQDMIAQLNIPEVQAPAPVNPYGSPAAPKKSLSQALYEHDENVPSQHAGLNFFSPVSVAQADTEQVATSAAAQNTF